MDQFYDVDLLSSLTQDFGEHPVRFTEPYQDLPKLSFRSPSAEENISSCLAEWKKSDFSAQTIAIQWNHANLCGNIIHGLQTLQCNGMLGFGSLHFTPLIFSVRKTTGTHEF